MIPNSKRWKEEIGADPWRKPDNQPLPWWIGESGTCPGCSRVCGLSCYAAKANNYYDFATRRVPHTNLCDLVAGKGIPKIREKLSKGAAAAELVVKNPQKWMPPYGPEARPVGDLKKDYWTNVAYVNPYKVRKLFVRVHETGDFFDTAYARQWFKEASDYVNDYYPREVERFRRGEREVPPPRIYWWAYTRSWRFPAIRKVLQQFSTLRYPAEAWSKDARHLALDWDPKTGQAKTAWRVGEKQEPEQDAFAILLSADADTGVPWMKDAENRIMPVAYLFSEPDVTQADTLVNRVPGVLLQDYELRRNLSNKGLLVGSLVCPAEIRTKKWQAAIDRVMVQYGFDPSKPSDENRARAEGTESRKAVLAVDKQFKRGCGRCGMCRPNQVQKLANATWKRFVKAAREGAPLESKADGLLRDRSDDLTAYEQFMQSPKDFTMATPSSYDQLDKIIERTKKQRGYNPKWTLQRLAAHASSVLAKKGLKIPKV